MSPDDFASDGKTEPCSSLVAGTGFIEADETLEDDLSVLGQYPESVVGDPQDHALARCLAERDLDVVVGVADRILEQISNDSSKLVSVASHLGRRHMGRVDHL